MKAHVWELVNVHYLVLYGALGQLSAHVASVLLSNFYRIRSAQSERTKEILVILVNFWSIVLLYDPVL